MTTTPSPAPDTSREAIERKAKSLRWRRSEFNADDREMLDAAATLLALLDRAEAAEKERDELIDENSDLKNAPWPEWAERMKDMIRGETGYDGYDDVSNGIDLPTELDEMISELRSQTKTADAALSAEREKVDEWKQKAESAAQMQRAVSARECDYIRKLNAARADALEEAAKVAKDHKGAAKRKRAGNMGLRNSMRFASDEARAEIWAEERGEDIAAEIIERAIRALIPKETTT